MMDPWNDFFLLELSERGIPIASPGGINIEVIPSTGLSSKMSAPAH
jgi:hypothetical protein